MSLENTEQNNCEEGQRAAHAGGPSVFCFSDTKPILISSTLRPLCHGVV